LTVETNGEGSINPVYNDTPLQIGKNYTITATPAKNFLFENWSGGTSLPLTVLTNKPTLFFTMESNLVLEANLENTKKPYLSITNVKKDMFVTNAGFTVMGRATDDWSIASVSYSFNRAPFKPAMLNGRSWSAGVTFTPGTNIFAAYAMDPGGEASATDTVKIIYKSFALLTVETNGKAVISPKYNHELLEVGKGYTIKATPAKGYAFANWSGGTNLSLLMLTNKPTLKFIMESNLVLEANLQEDAQAILSVNRVFRTPGGAVVMNLNSAPGATTRVWVTTNLYAPDSWRCIYTNATSTNSVWQFIDTNAAACPARFYRFSTP
jgi:hypothetical protein